MADGISLRLAFQRYDQDGNGSINAEELVELCLQLGFQLSDQEVDVALAALDTDHSGTISFDEFQAWWSGKLDGLGSIGAKLGAIAEQCRKQNLVDIHSASFHGSLSTVQEFLAVDPALARSPDETDDGDNNTPLHYAVYDAHLDIASLLINEYKVNINARNKAGCTPLFLAAQQGHTEAVRLLLSAGARINIADSVHGFSPLDVAANEAVRAVLQDGCDVSVPGRPERAPQVGCSVPGLLEVSWSSYRGAGKATGKSLPVGSFLVQVLRSNQAEEDSDDEGPVSPGGEDDPASSERAFLKQVQVKGADAKSTSISVDYSFPVQVRIAACNGSGASEWSDRSEPILCAKRPTVSKAPIISVLSRTAFEVSWDKAKANGSPLVGYKLEANDDNDSQEWESMGVFPANTFSATIESLQPGKLYSFRVVASNGVGKSKPGPACAFVKTKGLAWSKK